VTSSHSTGGSNLFFPVSVNYLNYSIDGNKGTCFRFCLWHLGFLL